jgi:hypothetical protein
MKPDEFLQTSRSGSFSAADQVRPFGLQAYRVIHKVSRYVKVPSAVGQIFRCLSAQTHVLQNDVFLTSSAANQLFPLTKHNFENATNLKTISRWKQIHHGC